MICDSISEHEIIINKIKFALKNESSSRTIQKLCIVSDELSAFTALYSQILSTIQEINEGDMLPIAKFLSQQLKTKIPRVYEKLQDYLKEKQGHSIFIQGLPELSILSNEVKAGELISLIFSYLIGEPFQYLQQSEGKVVSHVTPKEGYEATQSGLNRVHFGWHTDDRIFPEHYRTRWIQLLGIHNPESTETIIASIDEIVKRISMEDLQILMEERFEVKMPTSFGFKNSIWSEPIKLISKNNEGQYEVGVPTYNVRVIDHSDIKAKNSLDKFINIIDSCKSNVAINPGTLLIFNNDRVLHGRTAFSGSRLLLRTYIRENLDDLRKQTNTNGNVFDARLLI